jgi:hypothetical protein
MAVASAGLVACLPTSCLWWPPKKGSEHAKLEELEKYVHEHLELLSERHRTRPCKESAPNTIRLLLNTLRKKPAQEEKLHK